ncbi:hypothetical protein BAUCODRAFT_78040 [Baudoinia panamericana UAMH 10762]|uniref:Cytochrome P450 n=1 Tax=Baudoinia panamericana (strain UAMH 10762) TaxID=717646 RepID=M2M7Z6_BAUPA|nr:uncharacterized protein BAUCODRAFT_78040 [Baudoinia panamericana UAMH 10762]EMC92456.1 hypothetical protein BAUCODRAFT_78040 [Baudoinia panamericana UAMH 10762]
MISSHPVDVVLAARLLGVCVALSCALIIRQLFYHPLSGVPGPRLAALTSWWECIIDLHRDGGGRYYFYLKRLHEEYACPIVRIGPNEVHVTDNSWLPTLFGAPGSVRHKSLAHILGSNLGSAFGTVDHYLHRQRRASIAPLFSTRAVKAIEPEIQATVEQLCMMFQQMKDDEQIIELRRLFLAFATDVSTSYIFRESLGMLQSPAKTNDFATSFSKMQGLFPLLKQCLWLVPCALKAPLWLVQIVMPGVVPLLQMYRVSANCEVEKQDLFRAILESKLPPHEKSYHRIAHEGVEALIAGSLTTGRVLALATFHILSSAVILGKVQDEAHKVMPDHATIPSIAVLESSAYLRAIVKEALRLAHIVTARFPVVAPREDLHYQGHTLPANTIISVTPAWTLMNSDVFAEPYTFRPERWLEADTAHLAMMEQYWIPFGLGNRRCLGIKRVILIHAAENDQTDVINCSFAMTNILTALTVVFRRFQLELVDTVRERDVDHSRTWFIGEPRADSLGIRVRVVKAKEA